MMTSSNENIFRVTGHLCGEFIGDRWIPSQSPVTRSFMFSSIWAWMNGWINIHEAGDLRRHSAHYDVTVMLMITLWGWGCGLRLWMHEQLFVKFLTGVCGSGFPSDTLHRGPTDVEDDRPPHPKMARAVPASGLYASIVTFHALKCWLIACELTYTVYMNSCECCIYGKQCPFSLYRRWQNSVGMWRTTNAGGTHDVVDDNLGCGRRHSSVNVSNYIKHVLISGRWISHG